MNVALRVVPFALARTALQGLVAPVQVLELRPFCPLQPAKIDPEAAEAAIVNVSPPLYLNVPPAVQVAVVVEVVHPSVGVSGFVPPLTVKVTVPDPVPDAV